MGESLFILAVLFLTFVAPIWIILHYVTRWRTARALSTEDERLLADLLDSAQRMEARLQTLERLLDVEAPGWRTRG